MPKNALPLNIFNTTLFNGANSRMLNLMFMKINNTLNANALEIALRSNLNIEYETKKIIINK